MASPFDFRARIRDVAQAFAAPPLPLVGAPRVDAAPNLTPSASNAASGASMMNPLSGLGGARDSGAAARPNPYRVMLAPDELLALMRGGLYRRLVQLLPAWSTWKGWTIQDDSDEAHPLKAEMEALDVQGAIRRADIWGRAMGETLLWPVTIGDRGQLHEPLRMETIKGIRALHVLDKREFTAVAWETDPESEHFGRPSVYLVHPRRRGAIGTMRVHASRVWLFGGHELPPSEQGHGDGYGAGVYDAIGQVLWDALRDMSQTSAAGAHLAQELSIAVFTFGAKMQAKQQGSQRESVMKKASFVNYTKSVMRSIYLGTSDKFERVSAQATGYKDLSAGAQQFLALVDGTPIALLFGQAPSGLSTDEGSWWSNWTARCAQHQDDRYRKPLRWLIEMAYYAHKGSVPEGWTLHFNPLGELTAKEKAEVFKIYAEADSKLLLDSVVSVERIRRSRYGTGGWSADIQPPTTEEEELEAPAEAEQDIAAAVAELARLEAARGTAPPPGTSKPDSDADDDDDAAGGQEKKDALFEPGRADRAADSTIIALEVPSGVGYAEARLAAGALLPELEHESWPHITLLYLGSVGERRLVALQREITALLEETRETLRDHEPKMFPGRLGFFGSGEPGPGGVPIVIEYHAWGVDHLQVLLLRALAKHVSVRQYARFLPHATLGYLPRTLTPAEGAELARIELDDLKSWPVVELVLRRGGLVVARYPIQVGRLDEE